MIVLGCSRADNTVVLTRLGESPELGTLRRETHDFWGDSTRSTRSTGTPTPSTPPTLASTDILLHASAMESFGMVMVEAMSVGVPVIAAASAGARDIVTNGDNGLLFPVGDVTGLVEGVRLLAQDSTLRICAP